MLEMYIQLTVFLQYIS